MNGAEPSARRWPVHGWWGVGLVLVFWTLNWSLTGLRTQWGFFPLWLGYCLTVDALVVLRRGTSLLSRSLQGYVALFLLSAPGWWLFELLNWRTQNWFYEGAEYFSTLQYFLLCSLGFAKLFEMPLLGYGGYLVFGWELLALYQLLGGIGRRGDADYLQLVPD